MAEFRQYSTLFQPIQQAAVAAIFPVALFGSDQTSLSQISQGSAGGGFGELQIFGDCGNGGPAGVLLVGPVGQVYVDRDGPVGQIHSVKLCKISH